MKSEHRIQQEIVIAFNNTYPELRGLLNYNNNNSRDAFDGKKNKYLGIIAGRSDLVLYFQGGAWMIELKDYRGTQKPAQKKWADLIRKQGFEYVIIRSKDEFMEYVKMIIGY